jgi:RNA polymerase sigma factor (sigma-70 family)
VNLQQLERECGVRFREAFTYAVRLAGAEYTGIVGLEAEDLQQEALLAMWKASQRDGAFSYLVGAGRNAIIEAQRRCGHTSRRGYERLAPASLAELGEDAATTPDTGFWRRYETERVHRALRLLPEKERRCVILRDLQGLTVDEVAVQIGRRYGTAMHYICHGRKRLRELLEGDL